MTNLKHLQDHWLNLNKIGHFEEAETFYYDELFKFVISNFQKKYSSFRENEVLFSILGFSPEPIILTNLALKPVFHKIITSSIDKKVIKIINNHIDPKPEIIELKDESFDSIYNELKSSFNNVMSRNLSIDITGGKKSMVSITSIFARDFGCRLLYVDFDVYIKELRKPLPGTEKLKIIFEPKINI